jgi:hypothetical protein
MNDCKWEGGQKDILPRRALDPIAREVGESGGDIALDALAGFTAIGVGVATAAAIAAAPAVAAEAAACDGDKIDATVAGGNCGAGFIGSVNIFTAAGIVCTGADL